MLNFDSNCYILYSFLRKIQGILLIYYFKGYIIYLYLQFGKSYDTFVMEETKQGEPQQC